MSVPELVLFGAPPPGFPNWSVFNYKINKMLYIFLHVPVH